MRQILKIVLLALLIVLGGSLQNKASAQYSDDQVSYQTFYDDLSPYGQWIDYPEYGYVWSPNEGADFRPYSSNGHWVYSDDYEWMWVSDYEWGWAPFHYGRWFNDPAYGWLWVPGYEWAPAWVAWRSGGDYYGWAPLRPGISIGVDFSLGNYYAPDDYWCFTPSRYITSPRVYDYCIDRGQNFNFISTTIIINNYNRSRNVFITGPRRSEAEGYCGRINPVQFRQSSRPGRAEFRNNQVAIYRPNVQRDDNRRFSPRNFNQYNRQPQNGDNRIGRNDNRPGRNDNGFRRNDDVNNRGNNLPVHGQNNDNRFRQPQNNNGNNNNGNNNRGNDPRSHQFERHDDNNRQPGRNDGGQVPRQPQGPATSTPGNNDNRQANNDNRFNERRNNRDNNRDFRNDNPPVRQQQPQTRNDNPPVRQQPQVRNDNPPVRQPQVRNDNNSFPRQPARQIDRPVQRQEQPRNFERRDNSNRNQGNGGNNGRGGGRRRN